MSLCTQAPAFIIGSHEDENNITVPTFMSVNGKFRLTFDAHTGTIVIYEGDTPGANLGNASTCGPHNLALQWDCNLVIYNNNGQPTWASNTYRRGRAPVRLELADDGTCRMIDKDGVLLWQHDRGVMGCVIHI
jgi:hypothetical protein